MSAYEEGKKAFYEFIDINPYQEEEQAWYDWEDGWNDAYDSLAWFVEY